MGEKSNFSDCILPLNSQKILQFHHGFPEKFQYCERYPKTSGAAENPFI
jgi:hypothetical protein